MTDIILMYVKVFCVGGLICVIGQVLINLTKLTAGKILVYFLLAGVLFESFGLYQYLVDFAGAGATVPISGFGYLLAKGAMEGAKIDFYHALTGGLVAGAAGLASAMAFGYLFSVIFNAKSKEN